MAATAPPILPQQAHSHAGASVTRRESMGANPGSSSPAVPLKLNVTSKGPSGVFANAAQPTEKSNVDKVTDAMVEAAAKVKDLMVKTETELVGFISGLSQRLDRFVSLTIQFDEIRDSLRKAFTEGSDYSALSKALGVAAGQSALVLESMNKARSELDTYLNIIHKAYRDIGNPPGPEIPPEEYKNFVRAAIGYIRAQHANTRNELDDLGRRMAFIDSTRSITPFPEPEHNLFFRIVGRFHTTHSERTVQEGVGLAAVVPRAPPSAPVSVSTTRQPAAASTPQRTQGEESPVESSTPAASQGDPIRAVKELFGGASDEESGGQRHHSKQARLEATTRQQSQQETPRTAAALPPPSVAPPAAPAAPAIPVSKNAIGPKKRARSNSRKTRMTPSKGYNSPRPGNPQRREFANVINRRAESQAEEEDNNDSEEEEDAYARDYGRDDDEEYLPGACTGEGDEEGDSGGEDSDEEHDSGPIEEQEVDELLAEGKEEDNEDERRAIGAKRAAAAAAACAPKRPRRKSRQSDKALPVPIVKLIYELTGLTEEKLTALIEEMRGSLIGSPVLGSPTPSKTSKLLSNISARLALIVIKDFVFHKDAHFWPDGIVPTKLLPLVLVLDNVISEYLNTMRALRALDQRPGAQAPILVEYLKELKARVCEDELLWWAYGRVVSRMASRRLCTNNLGVTTPRASERLNRQVMGKPPLTVHWRSPENEEDYAHLGYIWEEFAASEGLSDLSSAEFEPWDELRGPPRLTKGAFEFSKLPDNECPAKQKRTIARLLKLPNDG